MKLYVHRNKLATLIGTASTKKNSFGLQTTSMQFNFISSEILLWSLQGTFNHYIFVLFYYSIALEFGLKNEKLFMTMWLRVLFTSL